MAANSALEAFAREVEDPVDFMPYVAVLVSWVCFGSFAVPMKWQSVVDAKVHPLVFQCYKTWWTFVTSHAVLLFGEPYRLTWWGLASGLSWVPAGVAAVLAVRHVGIAYAQAVWQVTIIGSSFVWGFVVLQDESVRDWPGTILAVLCLIFGVVGMTLSFSIKKAQTEPLEPEVRQQHVNGNRDHSLEESAGSEGRPSLEQGLVALQDGSQAPSRTPEVSMCVGLAAALFNGLWGGANLVPSHFSSLHGTEFVLSFATGAAVVNLVMLGVYALFCRIYLRTPMPSLELRVMALPGFLSGTLWSIGNFCSLYVVSSVLGQGIGYALIQSSVMVSGLWGILFYKEMSGRPVLYWSLCCLVCTVGVVLLAYERKPTQSR